MNTHCFFSIEILCVRFAKSKKLFLGMWSFMFTTSVLIKGRSKSSEKFVDPFEGDLFLFSVHQRLIQFSSRYRLICSIAKSIASFSSSKSGTPSIGFESSAIRPSAICRRTRAEGSVFICSEIQVICRRGCATKGITRPSSPVSGRVRYL